MLQAKDILIALSYYYKGDWESIYKHITNNKPIDEAIKVEAYKNTKSSVITILDADYPNVLSETYHPPFVLYYYGNLNLLNNDYKLGVVGSRQVSSYGIEITNDIIKDLYEMSNKVVIVSGMAKGIDATAMRQAIKENGEVIAILGSGIDNPYPNECKDIYEYCKTQKGLVISEYPNMTKPLKEHFPFRNRLIASFSNSILIPEAKIKSGTSITIRYALERGLDINVVPHRVSFDNLNNKLIKDGALLCEDGKDVFESLTRQAHF